ncbi:L-lactate permease [Mesorhizobium sp. BAC0120]|uniref:L-lactate permease n=1 Tax=Mesorhizobium sp. BAC0120 TaxID=3090670 RepID=UPI00298CABBD|nr:L-lactate permease [Mesorhizobium sp. BAC0120]MDW6020267.1 L-lactate permease [Mesorhizobium sp. BAC0120]
METAQVPVDLLHWVLAILSIVALLVFLVPLRWRAPEAGPMAMFVSGIVALLAFRTPWDTLAVAGAKGVWDAIFILYVIWPALLLYQITKQAGAYDALRQGISRFSRNDLFIILALCWVFASFLQGIVGFGAPVAVVVPLLITVGVKPVYAVAMGVLAHAWARFFGTLGVGWLALLRVSGVEDVVRAAYESSLLILIPTYLAGFLVVWLYGRGPAVRHAWPLVLILGTILGVGQLLVALFSPELSTFLAGAVALLALYPLSRWRRYGDPVQGITNRPAMVERQVSEESEAAPVMGLAMSFLPYLVLTAVTLGVLLIPSINEFMRRLQVGLPFPAVETGFGVRNAAIDRYAPITVFTHPGMMVLITSVIVWIVYRAGGYYRAWAERHTPESIWSALLVDAVPASVPVIAFLVTSRILDHSGQILTLAYGIAAVSPPLVYAGVASVIGALGAFMTSSSTASCVLFGGVQSSVAQLHGMSRETIIAAQAAGSAYGNAIAPANIVLGTSVAGASGQEGAVLRITLPWTVIVAILTGVATIALVVFAR